MPQQIARVESGEPFVGSRFAKEAGRVIDRTRACEEKLEVAP